MLANHHTHSLFSDGSSQPEEYILQAIAKGFNILGFTEHSPIPFDNAFSFKMENKEEYIALMNTLKHKYAAQLAVYSGMEMEFIPGLSTNFQKTKAEYKLDYLIGSVHLVRTADTEGLWFTDGPDYKTYDQGLDTFFGGNIKKAVSAYFNQTNVMIETQHFDIIGHLDKIKMHNQDRFFKEDEPWYKDLINETLTLIEDKDLIVEVNTRGIYKKRSETTYPGLDILKLIKQRHIPVMVNSDAHKPEEIDGEFRFASSLLKSIGIHEVVYFNGNGWVFDAID